ncbi:ferritin-like domain-containing protein [Tepidibacillus marianensis]|uniref:ferritin-like domain-containing protein n=1 Tax=Tepidibacillus marianensis TaxID=3131995 RepID=UPI0030D291BF
MAITDERGAIDFYTRLLAVAPTEIAKYSVQTALDDEKIHNKQLTRLYKKLTGHKPVIVVKKVEFHHFFDGLQKAFLGEVKAAEFYKEMYLSVFCPNIRDILYSIQHDEVEHSTLFNWVHTEIKA